MKFTLENIPISPKSNALLPHHLIPYSLYIGSSLFIILPFLTAYATRQNTKSFLCLNIYVVGFPYFFIFFKYQVRMIILICKGNQYLPVFCINRIRTECNIINLQNIYVVQSRLQKLDPCDELQRGYHLR